MLGLMRLIFSLAEDGKACVLTLCDAALLHAPPKNTAGAQNESGMGCVLGPPRQL